MPGRDNVLFRARDALLTLLLYDHLRGRGMINCILMMCDPPEASGRDRGNIYY